MWASSLPQFPSVGKTSLAQCASAVGPQVQPKDLM